MTRNQCLHTNVAQADDFCSRSLAVRRASSRDTKPALLCVCSLWFVVHVLARAALRFFFALARFLRLFCELLWTSSLLAGLSRAKRFALLPMAKDDVPIRADLTTVINSMNGIGEARASLRRSGVLTQADMERARKRMAPRPKAKIPTAIKLDQPASNKPMARTSSGVLKPGQGGDVGLRDAPSFYELHRWASTSSLELASITAPLTSPPRSKWPLEPPPRLRALQASRSQTSITPLNPLGSRADLVIKPALAAPPWTPDERITRHLCTAGGSRIPPGMKYCSSLDRFPLPPRSSHSSTYRASFVLPGPPSPREMPALKTFRGWNDPAPHFVF